MVEKRYYQRDFEELYYIIDSNVISEKEFDEKEMYDGYTAFEDSMTGEEIVDLLNALYNENEHYKSIFFELVETALTDKNCRELYCKGILDIFNKANSLNQAREMIKAYLE